ncbi:hypothetical protein IP90_00946 [Luteimonas cucumeris]|uniref:Phage P22-like portal protein n=1 Tax=Luteimonas cucumeris TaxID=985012 RepID=A0A562LB20_9GAMM|nr:6-phosphogluconolactonase [Luteimonas cucumeris]TWI04808.1 hypothetical protein IP90_00946 [Luteimonas cucumeris]
MTDKAKEGPDHGKLLRQFEESFDETQEARREAERDRDYYDNKQLTQEELATLAQRKQPPVISNRIKPKVDALLGFEKRQRTDPKAYPRTPKHEQEADSVTDAIRFVCDQNRFSMIRSEAAENMFIEGIGAATVTAAKSSDGQMDVRLTAVPWDRFYYDPHSRRRDFSDAGYKGVVLWMDEADALSQFSGKEDVLRGCYVDSETEGETYDDRPRFAWSDKKRKRVRVLQHRWREKGVWMTAIVCKGGFLRDPQESPYLDEDGNPECDLIAVSAYVDRDNNRYGAVRTMISPQDEINKRRSKALHLLNSKKIIAEQGAVLDVEQARREAARPDGYLEVAPTMRFEFVDEPGLVQGQFMLLQEAKAEIDASGVNPALEGDLKAPSGRAVEALTQAGLAEQAIAFDALRDWSWRVYRAVWHRVRQYWTEERWIRVTDDERNLKWVAINKPVLDELGQPTGQVDNQLSELDIDLILEDGPDSVTIQSEQFEQLVELKKADPQSISSRAVIEASSLRNKDKILEEMEQGGIPPQVQQQMQEMQQALEQCQQQLQEAEQKAGQEQEKAQSILSKAQADIQVAEANLARERAEMQLAQLQWEMEQAAKGREFELRQYEAETARMAALKPEPANEQPNQAQ